MKKFNLLMLLTSVFLLFNCRTELANEEKTDEASAFHSQNNKITFREFLKITQNNEDDLLNSKNGKNSSLNEFDIDTSYILKRTEEANITKFSLLLKKKNETNKHIVYNMLYYRTKLGEWKYFIIKVEHTPNPNKLYGWKKTSLYKLQDNKASKGCNSSYQFGNIDWFQCSAGHGPDCSKNGGACCAGCHHSMAVSYWVNSCDQSASEEFDINYGGGSSNPITMEDVKNAIKNNVSAETYQKFSSLSYNLQQGVISCFYNDYLANDLVSAIIDFFYTHPNTQNPDVIYYRLSDFIKSFTLSQQDWLKNNLNIALPLLDHYTNNNNNNLQFSNWAINFFIQNPNTSWTQFQNWFMGVSEGTDGDYDSAFWDNPNLTFPAQNLPSWQNYYNAFPKNSNGNGLPGPDIYEIVKGTPKALRDGVLSDSNPNNDHDYDNACALRVSIALNYSGVTIPYIQGKTFKGGDGKYYFLGAKNLNAWMRKTFGIKPSNPNHINITSAQAGPKGINLPTLLTDNNLSTPTNTVYIKGIYSLVSSNPAWASGHADILQPNGICINGCHFFDAPIEYIDIWVLH